MASNAEIARDLLVASLGRGSSGMPNGDWIGEQYKLVLTAVGEAVAAEEQRERDARAARRS